MSRGPGTPSRDLTSVVLCSSRMMSMQSSTHSSQMKTVGPAMSFLTSCWLLPQKEQYSVFLESPPLDLVIATPSPAERGQGGRNRQASVRIEQLATLLPGFSSISAPDRSTTG